MTLIPFYTDDITITPHTATLPEHIGRRVSIREFASGRPAALYRLDNGEYLVKAGPFGAMLDFMEGPES